MGVAHSLFDLSGLKAVVTGSTRGIGRAIAERFVEHGADVVISGRRAGTCDAVAAEINATNAAGAGKALACAAHVGRERDLSALLAFANQEMGRIDILVANAAVHIHVGPSAELEDAVLAKTLEANLWSLHRLCQGVLPGMIERRFGRIISIASVAALFGSAQYHSYSVSKAAGLQYIRNIAVEHGRSNVRANSIAPGLTRTDMAASLIDDPVALAAELDRATVGRAGEPDEIAGAAVFLASPAGAYVNGQTLAVDGGQSIRY
jgi:NAD(P)-dependent dehydrogenase (short-subunit alcohol dehydrogenase family)